MPVRFPLLCLASAVALLAAPRFTEVGASLGLPALSPRDVLTFADLDNDGHAEAIVARHLDYLRDNFVPPALPPHRTSWQRGRGDGTFEAPHEIEDAPATTAACPVAARMPRSLRRARRTGAPPN